MERDACRCRPLFPVRGRRDGSGSDLQRSTPKRVSGNVTRHRDGTGDAAIFGLAAADWLDNEIDGNALQYRPYLVGAELMPACREPSVCVWR